MKPVFYLLSSIIILSSCGGKEKPADKSAELVKLKKERADLDARISKLEAETKSTSGKSTPVAVTALEPIRFKAFVEVQGQVNGDQNVNATSQAPGIIEHIMVKPGQHVSKGQVLAVLDASVVEQQIKALEPQLELQQSLYQRQQKLWAQNIGTEVQLLSAKAQYEATTKQKAALVAQRAMYTIKSPIAGTVDQVNVKEGDAVNPGMNGIRVVSFDKLKVTATLGENYLGKVSEGNPVDLQFADIGDTIRTKLSYVAKAVDPVSRAFQVEVHLSGSSRLYPNMSCKMQITNYERDQAIAIPVSVIQKTAAGEMVYIADGNKAKSVMVTTGRNANGMVEVLSGLKAGDKLITEGYEELDNGEMISVQ